MFKNSISLRVLASVRAEKLLQLQIHFLKATLPSLNDYTDSIYQERGIKPWQRSKFLQFFKLALLWK